MESLPTSRTRSSSISLAAHKDQASWREPIVARRGCSGPDYVQMAAGHENSTANSSRTARSGGVVQSGESPGSPSKGKIAVRRPPRGSSCRSPTATSINSRPSAAATRRWCSKQRRVAGLSGRCYPADEERRCPRPGHVVSSRCASAAKASYSDTVRPFLDFQGAVAGRVAGWAGPFVSDPRGLRQRHPRHAGRPTIRTNKGHFSRGIRRVSGSSSKGPSTTRSVDLPDLRCRLRAMSSFVPKQMLAPCSTMAGNRLLDPFLAINGLPASCCTTSS